MSRRKFMTRVGGAAAPLLLAVALNGCGETETKSDCDSLDARNAVMRIATDDDHAALVNFAIQNSGTVAEMIDNSASARARSANLARLEEIKDEWTKTNRRLAEAERQGVDDISSYQKRLDQLQEERARLQNQDLKLDAEAAAEKSAIWQKARHGAVYALDEKILTNRESRARGAVACTGLLYVTVGDMTAQKEVEFRVERSPDGKMSVSVDRFQF
jgi:hypothetical protein